MATFLLLHGATGSAAQWWLLDDELGRLGHDVIAVDLPCDQPVGLAASVAAAVGAVEAVAPPPDRASLFVVGQSLGGLVTPLVAAELDAAGMIFLGAMIPEPGRPGHEFWTTTGHPEAIAAAGWDGETDDLYTQDISPELLAIYPPERAQTGEILDDVCPLTEWPDIDTFSIVFRDDRFFPHPWLAELIERRLGVTSIAVPGGHLGFVSQPAAVAEALHSITTT